MFRNELASIASTARRRQDGLHKLRLHTFDIPVFVDQLLDDRLIVMVLESFATSVSLEEVEDGRIVAVSR